MKYKDVDWSSWNDMPSESTYNDWLTVRKSKMTQTAINRTAPHINKLFASKITADEAMGVAVEKEWRGIKYQWIMNAISQDMTGLADMQPAQLEDRSTRDIPQEEALRDRTWAN